jgi:hypothetical protein
MRSCWMVVREREITGIWKGRQYIVLCGERVFE